MRNEEIVIRVAKPEDSEKLLNIYAPYVKETVITFEYDVPTVADFEEKITRILKRYPYLVAEREGEIVGYAYASAFRPRAAYDWAVETSIYIKKECRGNGVGKKLYGLMEEILEKQNIRNLYACIAYTSKEDVYLTNTSFDFHGHLGYQLVGRFANCGYKFNRWYDMIWMEKIIAEHTVQVAPVVTFESVRKEFGL